MGVTVPVRRGAARSPWVRTVIGLIAFAGSLAACGGQSNPVGDDVPVSSKVDPQVLQDVIDATFMIPGPEVLRAMRVGEFGRQLAVAECGGEPGSIESTAGRIDQSRFPDLALIRERGFSEQEAVEEEDRRLAGMRAGCQDLSPDLASYARWFQLQSPWLDVFESVDQDPDLLNVKSDMATCLTTQTGLQVDPGDPTAFLRAVNLAVIRGATQNEERQLAVAYADCGTAYFADLRAGLLATRPEMVERHRELLEQYAAEIVDAGYAP